MTMAVDYRAIEYAPAGFLDSDGLTGELSGAELLDRARVAAAGLTHHGIGFGDRVVIIAPTGPDYLAVLVGCLLTGIVPATVASPAKPADDRSAGVRHLRAAVEVLAPAAVVTTDPRLAPAVPAGTPLLTVDDLRRHGRIPRRALRAPEPEQVHHIQLTSGSTSFPKAAVLTHAAVAANLDGLRTAMGLAPGRDRVSMWVPLYHDMGLVLMLAGLTSGVALDLMAPTTFVRDPLCWLRHMGERGATVTAAPPFSYRVAADRFLARGAAGLELSALRHAYVGAEPIPVSALESFRDAFAGHGLADDTLAPCYGMAETVVATTMCTLKHPTTDSSFGRVRWRSLDGRRVVSCGTLVGGLSLRISRPDGHACVDGEVGAVEVSGASVMAGYVTPSGVAGPPGGWHDTGDLGMAVDGELYVVGRAKEMLIVRGRNLPPYDVEAVVEEHPLVRLAAVFSVPGATTEGVVAVVETSAQHAALQDEVTASVRRVFGLSLADVVCVPRGGIPRTTSGKRQRSAVRASYLAEHP